jgi:hypothetical protein
MSKKPGWQTSFLFIIFCLSAWLPAWAAVQAQERRPTEYQVKAAFIYNFLQFVDWPGKLFSSPASPFNIYVLDVRGENHFGQALRAYQGETVRGRKISVYHVRALKEIKDGHILVLSASERDLLPQITRQAEETGILTIGETEGFGRLGLMINFYLEENRVRFEINIDAARRAGLKISSELLKLARIIRQTT